MRYLLTFVLLIPVASWAGNCQITEYERTLAEDAQAAYDDGQRPTHFLENITTAQETSQFHYSTRFVRIYCTDSVFFKISDDGTSATDQNGTLISGNVDYFMGLPGSYYVSVIDYSTAIQ